MKPRLDAVPFQNIPIRSELGRKLRAGFLGMGWRPRIEKIDFRTVEARMQMLRREKP